jgi:hypothetical protein
MKMVKASIPKKAPQMAFHRPPPIIQHTPHIGGIRINHDLRNMVTRLDLHFLTGS